MKNKRLMAIPTRANPNGLCALSSCIDKPLVVFPGSKTGYIQIVVSLRHKRLCLESRKIRCFTYRYVFMILMCTSCYIIPSR